MTYTYPPPGPFCLTCGASMQPYRKAGHSPLDGRPIYLYRCPNDRWWKIFPGHSMWLQGRYIR